MLVDRDNRRDSHVNFNGSKRTTVITVNNSGTHKIKKKLENAKKLGKY